MSNTLQWVKASERLPESDNPGKQYITRWKHSTTPQGEWEYLVCGLNPLKVSPNIFQTEWLEGIEEKEGAALSPGDGGEQATAEEILRDNFYSQFPGYDWGNVMGTEGDWNTLMNLALKAMEEYKNQSTPSAAVDEDTVIHGFTAPFRVGRKQRRAILDAEGKEVGVFKTGNENMAQVFCNWLNGMSIDKEQWVSVETKPKENEPIFLGWEKTDEEEAHCCQGYYGLFDKEMAFLSVEGWLYVIQPTHWQPLPQPPTSLTVSGNQQGGNMNSPV